MSETSERIRREPLRRAITVLLNTSAGGGCGPETASEIAEHFKAAGAPADVIALGPGEDPYGAARAASAQAGVVVAAGGDGTVSRVAEALVDSPAAFGVLPMGTLNHFARDMKLPLDLAEAAATIVSGREVPIDLAQVNDRLFLNNSSIGIYPSVVDLRDDLRRQGYRKWTAFAIAIFRLVRHYRGVTLRITVNGRQSSVRTPFVFVGNNEYTIEGIGLGARTSLTDGRLFVYYAPRVRTRDLPMLAVRALAGRAVQSGAFEIHSATELWIETRAARPIKVALDGETTVMRTPLHYRARPGALKVIV